ncbi:hypothetical protein P3T18_003184 [Paraburkholderia sp. GAS199]|uniref:DUF3331 domain-containing protein n=1 Tax=Paraburkholderia sp. GAS199 TaxID=3035126 RepID=UPI003D22B99B
MGHIGSASLRISDRQISNRSREYPQPDTHGSFRDPWAATISWLQADVSSDSDAATEASIIAPDSDALRSDASSAMVTFVERFGEKSISITWRDATGANYSEQLWMRRNSRCAGVCALTGAKIARGDAVYAPSTRPAVRPANIGQMIRAESVDKLG